MKLKRVLTSVFVLAAIFSSTNASSAVAQDSAAVSQETIMLNNEGVKLIEAKNYDLAIAKLNAALRAEPTYGKSRTNLAIAYNNKGISLQSDPTKAIVCFRHCLFIDPGNEVAQQNLDYVIKQLGKDPKSEPDRISMAKQARMAGDLKSAVVEYRAALKLKDEPSSHLMLADILRVLDQNEAAIDQYKLAAAGKETPEAYLKLGQALSSIKRLDEAIDAYEKGLAIDPSDPDLLDSLIAGWEEQVKQNPRDSANHLGLAKAQARRGNFGQAQSEAETARIFGPDRKYPPADQFLKELPGLKKNAAFRRHINNGNDFRARKMFPQAIKEYQTASELFPDDDESLAKLGETYALAADNNKAAETFKKILERSPENPIAKPGYKAATARVPGHAGSHASELARAAREARDAEVASITREAATSFKNAEYVGAIDKFQHALRLQPDNASLWRQIAEAYYKRDDFNNALYAYKKAFELDPSAEADGLYIIATIYEDMSQGEQALKAYREYVGFRPIGMLAQYSNNRITMLEANPKATERIQSMADQARDKDAETFYNSARALSKEKKWNEAIAAVTKSITVRPKEAKYYYLLGCIQADKGDLVQAKTAIQQAAALEPDNELYNLKLTAFITQQSGAINRTASSIPLATASSADVAKPIEKNRALLFGTNTYEDRSFHPLNNAILDCNTIADELRKHYGWEATVIENPTKLKIKSELRKLANQSYDNSNDQLFVFFAGHGMFDNVTGMAYLVTTESKLSDLERDTFMSSSELLGLIDNIKCPHTLVSLDVCESGYFDDYFKRTLASANRGDEYTKMSLAALRERKQSLTTRKLLTASGKESVSDGIPGKHSPFAYELLALLRSYGGKDGYYNFGDVIKGVERVKPGPRASSFLSDAPGSDFFFVPTAP